MAVAAALLLGAGVPARAQAEAPVATAADAPHEPAPRASSLPSFLVEVRDGRFTPGRIEIPARRRVRIELVNHGPGPLEFENDEMGIEKVLGAGGRSFVVLPPLQPGRHEISDEFNPITGVLEVLAR